MTSDELKAALEKLDGCMNQFPPSWHETLDETDVAILELFRVMVMTVKTFLPLVPVVVTLTEKIESIERRLKDLECPDDGQWE